MTAPSHYHAYGLTIQSPLRLLNAIAPSGSPDIQIHYGTISPTAQSSPDGQVQILRSKTGLATYRLTAGTELTIDAQPETDPDMLRANILGGCMAVLLKQRGYFVLHASCVKYRQGAIAFAGGSGWGKSTLSAYFGKRGCAIITDDILALDLNESPPKTISSYPQIKLSPEAIIATGNDPDDIPLVHRDSDKHLQDLHQTFETQSQPLQHVFLLKHGDRLHITEPTQHERFLGVMAFANVMPNVSPTLKTQQMQDCTRLLKAVPISYLHRPRSLSILEDTVNTIETYLNTCPPNLT